jgi:flagellar hook assembly protein FlgD
LPEAADVRIDVYNILGSRVTTLVDRKLEAGYHQVIWDAPNVASGLYLVQMKAGGFVHTRKAFLLK